MFIVSCMRCLIKSPVRLSRFAYEDWLMRPLHMNWKWTYTKHDVSIWSQWSIWMKSETEHTLTHAHAHLYTLSLHRSRDQSMNGWKSVAFWFDNFFLRECASACVLVLFHFLLFTIVFVTAVAVIVVSRVLSIVQCMKPFSFISSTTLTLSLTHSPPLSVK